MADRRSKITKPKKVTNYYIDLGAALEDDLLTEREVQDYLKANLKVNGKKGNLGENITITASNKKVSLLDRRCRQGRLQKEIPEVPHQEVHEEARYH